MCNIFETIRKIDLSKVYRYKFYKKQQRLILLLRGHYILKVLLNSFTTYELTYGLVINYQFSKN